VNQKADQRSIQQRAGYPNSGRQNANQRIDQNGAAFDNSVVDQYASQRSEQRQQREIKVRYSPLSLKYQSVFLLFQSTLGVGFRICQTSDEFNSRDT
jgi:hypothetical protein